MVGQREFDDARISLRTDPKRRQAGRQAEPGIQRRDGIGHRIGVTLLQAHGLGEAFDPALTSDAVGLGIEANDRRQKDRVERAVMQARVQAAQGVAERMHGAQPFLEGHRAVQACAHHVHAGVAVLAVARGAFDRGPAPAQALQRDAVGRRVEGWRQEGFDAVGDGVHAGGGRQQWRQPQGQCRIADRGLGQQLPVVKAQLAAIIDDQDGAARHLAAGACRRRHRDQRQHLGADAAGTAFDGGVVGQRPLVGGGEGHALGQVDAGAAADGDQAVAALVVADLDGLAHGGLGGVGGRLVEHRGRAVEGGQCLVQHAGRAHAGIGDDQGPAHADALAFGRQQAGRAERQLDAGQVEDLGHRVCSAVSCGIVDRAV
mmetsp:Transcript_5841/g.22869  ORF Transcript_5841/g.22869 Transcript_5841/m.22869 type:complete len:373 (-) Transcript_5841:223-1341(-)